MNEEIIKLIVDVLAVVAAYFLGKYLPAAKIKSVELAADATINAIETVAKWADVFVHDARQHLKNESGEDKMNYVISEVSKIVNKGMEYFTEEQIRAVAQKAYDKMVGKDNPEKSE